MSMLEGGSTVLGSDILEAESNDYLKKKLQAYRDFDFSQINRNPLAIDTLKNEILDLLTKESAIIIKGFTGCGKSTQVPQFILDDHYQRKVACNIVFTQPRTITIAERVCRERNWLMSTVVGYQLQVFHVLIYQFHWLMLFLTSTLQVAMDRMVQSELTCLTYTTTGCLLAMLVSRKSLAEYTHIIIDEVHERDEDTDLLLMIVRKFLYQTRCNTRVILMSATADASHFAQYFKTPVNPVFRPAPILEVDAPAPHQVRVFYLDDLKPLPVMKQFFKQKPIFRILIDPLVFLHSSCPCLYQQTLYMKCLNLRSQAISTMSQLVSLLPWTKSVKLLVTDVTQHTTGSPRFVRQSSFSSLVLERLKRCTNS